MNARLGTKKVFRLCLTAVILVICAISAQMQIQAAEDTQLSSVIYSREDGTPIYTIETGSIRACVSILNNREQSRTFLFINAVYSSKKILRDVSVVSVEISAKTGGNAVGLVQIPDDGEDYTLRSYIWSDEAQIPYGRMTLLSSLSNKKFDTCTLTMASPLGVTAKGSYTGITDTQAKTITFVIPYAYDYSDFENNAGLSDVTFAFQGLDGANVFPTPSSVKDIHTTRPTFTVTAEDGSTESYKVQIYKVLAEDDFCNAVFRNGVIVSGNRIWTPIANTCLAEIGTEIVNPVTGKVNTYLKMLRSNSGTAQETAQLVLKDGDGNNISLTGKVMLEFDFRLNRTSDIGLDFSHTMLGSLFSPDGNGIAAVELMQGAKGTAYPVVTGSEPAAGAGYQFYLNRWYHARIIVDTNQNSGAYLFGGCEFPFHGLSGGAEQGINSFAAFISETTSGLCGLDIDNVKLGVLID